MYVSKKESKSLSFMFIGDWGWQGLNQTMVANQMALWSTDNKPEFVIALGDNFYKNGVSSVNDARWNGTFHSVYHHDSLTHIHWYAILGNHDYHQQPQAEIDYYYLHRNSPPQENRWTMPDHNYTVIYEFDNATLQVVFIDTPILARRETEETDVNGKWAVSLETKQNHLKYIEDTLSTSNATWLIVAGHYTIYSNAEHGDTQDLIDCLVPLLEKYNVNAYLNGHDHTLQHISWHGIEYFTSGRGCETVETDSNGKVISDYPWGATGEKKSKGNEAGHFFSFSTGFSTAVATPDTLKISFIDHNGKNLYSTILANPRSANLYKPTVSLTTTHIDNYSTQTLYVIGIVSSILGMLLGIVIHLTFQQIRNKLYNGRYHQQPTFFAAVDLTPPEKKVAKTSDEKKVKNPIIQYEMVKDHEEDQAMINGNRV